MQNPPVIIGHEYAGEVVQVGKNVHEYAVGDHIAIDPNGVRYLPPAGAGRCTFCESLSAVGVNYDGGFAEYSAVPVKRSALAYRSASLCWKAL